MKQYKIFKHPLGKIEAVKQGWSWPAFFFNWIWALVKKMWYLGFGVLVVFVVLDLFHFYTSAENSTAVTLLTNFIILIIAIILGVKGNTLREKNLLSKGYELKDVTTASNTEGAKALFLKNLIVK
ncbi:MAG: DUF2628 domain-containing protein [Lentisphaerota bacterium]